MTHCVCIFILGRMQSSCQLTGAHFLHFLGPEKSKKSGPIFSGKREKQKLPLGCIQHCPLLVSNTNNPPTLNMPKDKSDKAFSVIVATITYLDDL